jgi:hypothetical protein
MRDTEVRGETVFSQREEVTNAVRSSERRATFVVAIRRFVLLAGFLLTGFVVAACWSASASAAERGADEAPPAYDRLLAAVAEGTQVEPGAEDAAHELVDVAKVADRVDEIPVLTQVLIGVLNPVGADPVNDVVSAAHRVGVPSDALVTVIDTMADRDVAYEAPSVSLLQAVPGGAVVERGWSPAEVTPSAVVPVSRAVTPTVSPGAAYAVGGDTPSVDHVHDDLSRQFPNGFPVSPFSASETGGGASVVSSSGGSPAGAVVPGNTRHDDVYVVSGVAADGVYAVRQLATVPQVSPA